MQNLAKWALLAAAIIVALVVFMAIRRRAPGDESARWPLYAKRLLSEREQVFYWRLGNAFPDAVVLAQVALSQLLGIEKNSANRQALLNRFRQLTADFVICTRSFEPLAVIELDGLSHDRPKRQEADLRKAKALESAGVVLLRVNVASMPDEAQLRELVDFKRSKARPSSAN